METLGQYLKKERLLHNAKIQDVSAATKIPVQTLQKIESDDWSQLPAAVFVKGFLKSYCHFLGLNTQDVLLRYDQQSIIPKVAQPLKENQKVSTQKNYPLYVWAGILTLAAIIFLFFISKKSEDIETATKLYSPMEATELNIPMPAPWYSEQGIQYYLRSYDSVWVKIQVDEFPVVSFPMDASTYKSFFAKEKISIFTSQPHALSLSTSLDKKVFLSLDKKPDRFIVNVEESKNITLPRPQADSQ